MTFYEEDTMLDYIPIPITFTMIIGVIYWYMLPIRTPIKARHPVELVISAAIDGVADLIRTVVAVIAVLVVWLIYFIVV